MSSRESFSHYARTLSYEEINALRSQDSSIISDFKKNKLEREATKNWDLFYKRNKTNFFKDRHWTLREFADFAAEAPQGRKRILLEVGCGVGNFFFPLLEEVKDLFVYACDFSPRAIDFVSQNPLYDEQRCKAFVCDMTVARSLDEFIQPASVDIVSAIFVLSAVDPRKHSQFIANARDSLKPGGIVFFRDYGLFDQAQLRFSRGHKIEENFYARQDGTRAYYFEETRLKSLFEDAGFETSECRYVQRQTVNKKEDLTVPRIFVQGRFVKK